MTVRNPWCGPGPTLTGAPDLTPEPDGPPCPPGGHVFYTVPATVDLSRAYPMVQCRVCGAVGWDPGVDQ